MKGLILAGIFGMMYAFSPDPGRDPARLRMAHVDPGAATLGFALSPDSKSLATTDNLGRVVLTTIRGGPDIAHYQDFRLDLAWGLTYSPDGRFLAFGGAESDIVIVDLAPEGVRRSLHTSMRQIRSLAF
jgi:hypothetical protein